MSKRKLRFCELFREGNTLPAVGTGGRPGLSPLIGLLYKDSHSEPIINLHETVVRVISTEKCLPPWKPDLYPRAAQYDGQID